MSSGTYEVRSKFDRSRQHWTELASKIADYLAGEPFSVSSVEDAGGDLVYRVQVNEHPPRTLSLPLGDAIHNARSALDYLAWQLVIAGGGTPDTHTEFPISISEEQFKASCSKKLRGASNAAIEAVIALQSFQGGDDRFWRLHKLDIEDKHHLLIPVGAAHAGVNVSHHIRGMPPLPMTSLIPANRSYPLQNATEVFRVMRAARDNPDLEIREPSFTFDVAFGEGVIVRGEPIFPTLSELIEGVEKAVMPLFRFLK